MHRLRSFICSFKLFEAKHLIRFHKLELGNVKVKLLIVSIESSNV